MTETQRGRSITPLEWVIIIVCVVCVAGYISFMMISPSYAAYENAEEEQLLIIEKFMHSEGRNTHYYVETPQGTYRIGWNLYSQVVPGNTYLFRTYNHQILSMGGERR